MEVADMIAVVGIFITILIAIGGGVMTLVISMLGLWIKSIRDSQKDEANVRGDADKVVHTRISQLERDLNNYKTEARTEEKKIFNELSAIRADLSSIKTKLEKE